METGFDVLKKKLGVISSDVFFVSGHGLAIGEAITKNIGYKKTPFIGEAGGIPYKVPPGHVLALIDITVQVEIPTSQIPIEVLLYVDKIDGETDDYLNLFTHFIGHEGFEPPILIPEHYFVGMGVNNLLTFAWRVSWHLNGYLWRLETGKPVPTSGP